MGYSIPRRHPEVPGDVPGLMAFARLLGLRKPSPQQWSALGEGLILGDELMDDLVDWMCAAGIAETRPLFERALRDGIEAVPEAPERLREFFAEVEEVPEWVDCATIRRAECAFRLGGTDGLYLARDVSFLGGYLASGFNQTLVRTGAMEKGPAQRFAETLQWALDVTSDGGMSVGGVGYQSTIRVRLIHAFVRRHVADMADWEEAEWGLPINQTDMAATLMGALIAPFVGALPMGVVLTPAELDAVAHLARYVGWLVGVRDEMLPTSFRDGVRILYHCLAAITNPDDTTTQLALPMVEDPLHWHYPNMPVLRGNIARSQHLSISSVFLGPKAMRDLGLPPYMLPWYLALRIPVNLWRGLIARTIPNGEQYAAARGRREQEAFLRTLVGNELSVVGRSADHMTRSA